MFRVCSYLSLLLIVQACGQNPGDPASGADATPIASNRFPEVSVSSTVEFLSGDAAIVATAAASAGDGFDLRRFHDRMLENGAIALGDA